MRIFLILFLGFWIQVSLAQKDVIQTPFEKGNGNQTTDYASMMDFYKNLAKDYSSISCIEQGLTDSGENLYTIIFDANPSKAQEEKTVLLINNGIHPGEPDGIDATMMFMRDLASGKIKPPKNTMIVAIPCYNIGGMLQRNSHSRVNQEGPESYGFRGNARNFDLNRDFIKSDTKNMASFAAIFHKYHPDVFVDTHVSNGADYQYTLTYIESHPQKLGKPLQSFVQEKFTPEILKSLDRNKTLHVPYVTVYNTTPEQGFSQMMDHPRYSTGYTALFHTIGYMVETHMLKPYKDRVKVTYDFLQVILENTDKFGKEIKSVRKEAQKYFETSKTFPLHWALDSASVTPLLFKGYEAGYKKSLVTGAERLYYDRSKPFEKIIPYYKDYKVTTEVPVPTYYVIPKSLFHVIAQLNQNHIQYQVLEKDTSFTVISTKIKNYDTSKTPYEGHYNHFNTTTISSEAKITFCAGDLLVPTAQSGIKYLIETLEPNAIDSFFNWNYFDSILQQKEGFSAYVFEDLAADLLLKDPDLQERFSEYKKANPSLEKHPRALLDWIYKNSEHYEKSHLQYPIYKIIR